MATPQPSARKQPRRRPAGTAEDYLSRARLNLRHLIGLYANHQEAAGQAGMTDDGIAYIAKMKGKRGPFLAKAVDVIYYLGADPEDLFMPTAAFAQKWTVETIRPKERPPRLRALDSTPSSSEESKGGSTLRETQKQGLWAFAPAA